MQQIYVRTERSKTLQGNHPRRCTIDLNFFVEESGQAKLAYDFPALKPVGDYWESPNPRNSWGGGWSTF